MHVSELDVCTVARLSIVPNLQWVSFEAIYPLPTTVMRVPPTQGNELGKIENVFDNAANKIHVESI
jgi:hypothetical protein